MAIRVYFKKYRYIVISPVTLNSNYYQISNGICNSLISINFSKECLNSTKNDALNNLNNLFINNDIHMKN